MERGARGDGQKKGKRVQGKTTARFFPLKERDILKRCTLFREGNVWKGVHPVRLDGACDLRAGEGKQCFQEVAEGAEETIEHTAEAGLRHTAKHEAGELSEKARQLLLDWLKAKEAWYAEGRKTRA